LKYLTVWIIPPHTELKRTIILSNYLILVWHHSKESVHMSGEAKINASGSQEVDKNHNRCVHTHKGVQTDHSRWEKSKSYPAQFNQRCHQPTEGPSRQAQKSTGAQWRRKPELRTQRKGHPVWCTASTSVQV